MILDEVIKFLEEMSGEIPYDKRNFKGSIDRQKEAKRLLEEIQKYHFSISPLLPGE